MTLLFDEEKDSYYFDNLVGVKGERIYVSKMVGDIVQRAALSADEPPLLTEEEKILNEQAREECERMLDFVEIHERAYRAAERVRALVEELQRKHLAVQYDLSMKGLDKE